MWLINKIYKLLLMEIKHSEHIISLHVCYVGQALLTLGMISPTGNPVSELSYKKTKVGMYTVSYKADEKGDHTLTIRWGPNDIPGSPFKIPIG